MEVDQRQALLNSIRGQTILMPDLRPIFETYLGRINPNYEELVPMVNARLKRLVPNKTRLAKLKTSDFALFASSWWPTADLEELKIVCFFAMWLFLWDDALDEPLGEYTDTFDGAQLYRAETKRFLKETLGLTIPKEFPIVGRHTLIKSGKGLGGQFLNTLEYFLGTKVLSHSVFKPAVALFDVARKFGLQLKDTLGPIFGLASSPTFPPKASHPIIESFRVIGDALKSAYTIEQRQNFFRDAVEYIDSTEKEQTSRLDGKVPTIEEYWGFRLGTSAIGTCLCVIEFANRIKGPYCSTNHPLLKDLGDLTNINVCIANDMLSLKKEIKQGCIDSLVPLLTPIHGGVQHAINKAHADLVTIADRFEEEAESILAGPNTTGMSDTELRIFIDGCRNIWVGNINWSLSTGRYGMGVIDQKSGSFPVTL